MTPECGFSAQETLDGEIIVDGFAGGGGASTEPKKSEYTGFCVLCGKSLTGGQRKYCTDCRRKYSRHAQKDSEA